MSIKEKIKNTRLFTNLEKIELLTKIDTFSAEAMNQLVTIIDEYDESLKDIKSQFNSEIIHEIEQIQQANPANKDMLETIKTGFNKILS